MHDPRDIIEAQAYDRLTSDEGEEDEIEEQIRAIERQKRDLLERLRAKRTKEHEKDPNFQAIQVEESPVKITNKLPASQQPPTLGKRKLFPVENPNEVGLVAKSQLPPAGSTPYFAARFSESKQKEQKLAQKYKDIISSRVHTFTSMQNYKYANTDEVEEYSHQWIRKRYIPKVDLQKILHEIKILRLGKLFAKVRPPTFEEPQYCNWAVIGIISQKGSIQYTSSANSQKYFKITLTDFKYNIDVFFFGKDAVIKYINIKVGDIIAILNPEIMPWRPTNTNNDEVSGKIGIKSFNLKISHKLDCILEIGASKELGWCPIINETSGKPCAKPINKGYQDRCEYHLEVKFRSTNAKRIELNSSFALGAPTKIERQPALYRGKNNKNTRPQYRMISQNGDQLNENTSIYATKAYNFSSDNAAKAFFNEKFQNPDMLNNLESKRRKILDDKRSATLDRQLRKAIKKKNSSEVDTKDEKELQSMRHTTETTLKSGLMKNLGFDPTHGQMATLLHKSKNIDSVNVEEKQKKTAVQELMGLKKDSITLKPSKIELYKKKARREKTWQEHFGTKPGTTTDSDSDLEIIPAAG